jgi:hypothetical protein
MRKEKGRSVFLRDIGDAVRDVEWEKILNPFKGAKRCKMFVQKNE